MKIKWLIYSISGLMVFGMGLSFLGEAIILKYNQNENWFGARRRRWPMPS